MTNIKIHNGAKYTGEQTTSTGPFKIEMIIDNINCKGMCGTFKIFNLTKPNSNISTYFESVIFDRYDEDKIMVEDFLYWEMFPEWRSSNLNKGGDKNCGEYCRENVCGEYCGEYCRENVCCGSCSGVGRCDSACIDGCIDRCDSACIGSRICIDCRNECNVGCIGSRSCSYTDKYIDSYTDKSNYNMCINNTYNMCINNTTCTNKNHNTLNNSIDTTDFLFIKIKELFILPDPRVTKVSGASIDGYYYCCYYKKQDCFKGHYIYESSCTQVSQRINLVRAFERTHGVLEYC